MKWAEKGETLKEVSASHPSRVRGLKSEAVELMKNSDLVAPLAGAWIEMP